MILRKTLSVTREKKLITFKNNNMKEEIKDTKRRLENLLLTSIRGYLIENGDIDECEIEIGNCNTARQIRYFDNGNNFNDDVVEVDAHYLDWDGTDYLITRTLENMDTTELYNIWEYLENKFGN